MTSVRPILVFVPCWGEKFTNYYHRGLTKSLSWPLNKKALKVSQLLMVDNPDFMPQFRDAIKRCIAENMRFLMACPDFIFSDGSIQVLKEFTRTPGACAGFVHCRVHDTILDDLDVSSGPQLVTRAWNHLHRSWKDADCTKGEANCYAGGVSWREMNGNILVQHRLPTALMVNFIPRDFIYFQRETFDAWDWRWPSEWEHRQRLIGSSDAAFMAEITDPGTHGPSISPLDPLEVDAFHVELSHHRTNRQFISVLRRG